MRHYVAYHKVAERGEYEVRGPYGHYSRFRRKRLEKIIDQTVWVISGTETRSGMVYKLCSTYVPTEVQDADSGEFCVFGRQGLSFNPHTELNEYSWFWDLYEKQRNFSLGMNIIQDENVIAGLLQIAQKQPGMKRSDAVHICVGRAHDVDLIDEGIENGTPVHWLVPKDAKPGDSVLFLIPSRTGPFEARGVVMEKPIPSLDWKNRYASLVGQLEWLPEPVSLEEVQTHFPDWKYLTNAKAYITVPPRYAKDLMDVIDNFPATEIVDINDYPDFNPTSLVDAKERILATIVRRRGQPKFRETLMKNYESKCAFTGYTAPDALEAAHIIPYKGIDFHHPANGLLLRADIHTLFDLHLLAVNTESMTILISPTLEETSYNYLTGKKLFLPRNQNFHPSKEALDMHREEAEL